MNRRELLKLGFLSAVALSIPAQLSASQVRNNKSEQMIEDIKDLSVNLPFKIDLIRYPNFNHVILKGANTEIDTLWSNLTFTQSAGFDTWGNIDSGAISQSLEFKEMARPVNYKKEAEDFWRNLFSKGSCFTSINITNKEFENNKIKELVWVIDKTNISDLDFDELFWSNLSVKMYSVSISDYII